MLEEALVIQQAVISLPKKYWVATAAKYQWALCFQLDDARRYTEACPCPTELWLLPAAERFIPGSCPKSNVWNNILPNLLAPLIWKGKQSLRFPAEKVCEEQNNACILPDSYSSDKSLPGWKAGTFSSINIIFSQSFLTLKNTTCIYIIIGW